MANMDATMDAKFGVSSVRCRLRTRWVSGSAGQQALLNSPPIAIIFAFVVYLATITRRAVPDPCRGAAARLNASEEKMSNLAPILKALVAQSDFNNQLLRMVATLMVRHIDLDRDEDAREMLNRVSDKHQEFLRSIEAAVNRAEEEKGE